MGALDAGPRRHLPAPLSLLRVNFTCIYLLARPRAFTLVRLDTSRLFGFALRAGVGDAPPRLVRRWAWPARRAPDVDRAGRIRVRVPGDGGDVARRSPRHFAGLRAASLGVHQGRRLRRLDSRTLQRLRRDASLSFLARPGPSARTDRHPVATVLRGRQGADGTVTRDHGARRAQCVSHVPLGARTLRPARGSCCPRRCRRSPTAGASRTFRSSFRLPAPWPTLPQT